MADYQRYCEQGYLACLMQIKALPGVISQGLYEQQSALVSRIAPQKRWRPLDAIKIAGISAKLSLAEACVVITSSQTKGEGVPWLEGQLKTYGCIKKKT